MPGIIDLPKFNYEDLDEIFCRWTGFIWNLLITKVVTYIRTTLTPFIPLFIPYKFLVRMMIKFRVTKEKEKGEDTIKQPQKKRFFFFLIIRACVKRSDVAYF